MKLTNLMLSTVAALGLALPAYAGGGKGGHADEMFKTMDADGDGKLSASEHSAGARKKFTSMDTNADGKVTAQEMTAAHHKMARKPMKGEMTAAEKIKTIDKDGDGALSADEHAAGVTEKFGKMDTDRDGFLTKSEMEAGHHKMMTKDGAKSSTTKDSAKSTPAKDTTKETAAPKDTTKY